MYPGINRQALNVAKTADRTFFANHPEASHYPQLAITGHRYRACPQDAAGTAHEDRPLLQARRQMSRFIFMIG
jgi:hypothetical protein